MKFHRIHATDGQGTCSYCGQWLTEDEFSKHDCPSEADDGSVIPNYPKTKSARVQIEIYDLNTGEILLESAIQMPIGRIEQGKVSRRLRSLGVTDLEPGLRETLGLAEYVGPAHPSKQHTLKAWHNALASKKLVQRRRQDEKRDGVKPFRVRSGKK